MDQRIVEFARSHESHQLRTEALRLRPGPVEDPCRARAPEEQGRRLQVLRNGVAGRAAAALRNPGGSHCCGKSGEVRRERGRERRRVGDLELVGPRSGLRRGDVADRQGWPQRVELDVGGRRFECGCGSVTEPVGAGVVGDLSLLQADNGSAGHEDDIGADFHERVLQKFRSETRGRAPRLVWTPAR